MRVKAAVVVAIAMLAGSAAIATVESAAAEEVVIDGTTGERGRPIQFQKNVTCTNAASCTVPFDPISAKPRFESRANFM